MRCSHPVAAPVTALASLALGACIHYQAQPIDPAQTAQAFAARSLDDPGLRAFVEASVEPIRNPVTGEEHRARVTIPKGFEYHEAEYASSSTRASGLIAHEWSGRHAHLCIMHMTQNGVVHA